MSQSQAGPSYPGKALAQAVPFQCKISELVVDTLVSWSPTAQASLPDRALTPERRLAIGPGLGLLTCVQAVPFQCTISERDSPLVFQ